MTTSFSRRFAARIPWVPFYNSFGSTIPPFSVVMATGWDVSGVDGQTLDADSPSIACTQPDGTGSPFDHYFTDGVAVPAGAYGRCARPDLFPLVASLASAPSDENDLAFRLAGPQAGSWQLVRDLPGFVMLAVPQSGYAFCRTGYGPYRGQVAPQPASGEGEAPSALETGARGPITPLSGPTGSETTTSATLPNVFNRFGSIDVGNPVLFDWTGNGWELIAADPC